MSRSMVGLLTAVATIMSALIGFTHGDLIPVVIAGTGAASGLVACLASPQGVKKSTRIWQVSKGRNDDGPHHSDSSVR
jgi:hypothetical protein